MYIENSTQVSSMGTVEGSTWPHKLVSVSYLHVLNKIAEFGKLHLVGFAVIVEVQIAPLEPDVGIRVLRWLDTQHTFASSRALLLACHSLMNMQTD